MKFVRIVSLISLLVSPACAQFGVAGGRKKKVGTSFQELNEKVKAEGTGAAAAAGGAGADDLAKLQEMMAKAFEDPAALEAINQLSSGLQDVMEELGKMDPEALQAQMEQAMKLMTQGDIMDAVISKKDEVLASLEQTGLVPPAELAKYKADPAYFEEQMKGAFDQMKGLFENPDLLKTASEAMKGMQEAMSDPLLTKMQELLMADSVSEVEIEELRLSFLQNPNWMQDNPSMAMFQGLSEEVKDARKFKNGFLEARKSITDMMGGMGMGMNVAAGGAGVGEL
ncbi:hypothetical protein MHU86_25312 [Fragilaria crotonensis]|nr:hypothetical protein MHU86_25312 [Fragilaria crotonensis]